METRSKFFIIGICCAFLNYNLAQQNIPNAWCDGIPVNTYIRNESDCRHWIRCNGSRPPSSGFCPSPSYFSLELQRCTSESVAKCFMCPSTTSITFEVVENSCKRFIRCVDGVASELMCGAGMAFNPGTMRCESEFHQECTLSTTAATTEISSVSMSTSVGDISTSTSAIKTSSTTTQYPIVTSSATESTNTVHSTTVTTWTWESAPSSSKTVTTRGTATTYSTSAYNTTEF